MLPCYVGINGMTLLRCPKDTCGREGLGVVALETVEQRGAFSRFRRSLDLNPWQKNATILGMTGGGEELAVVVGMLPTTGGRTRRSYPG
jgi:hypothetical protein